MNTANFDIVIVGAGIAGSVLARILAENSISVLLLEKDAYSGKTNACGGLLDKEHFDKCQISQNVIEQKISQNSEIANWTEKQICDGVTGATIMEDNYDKEFQQPQLFIGDSLIKYADVYGQYWIEVQCGTYPLTGKCEGFSNKTEIIKVLPDSREYLNFYIIQI